MATEKEKGLAAIVLFVVIGLAVTAIESGLDSMFGGLPRLVLYFISVVVGVVVWFLVVWALSVNSE